MTTPNPIRAFLFALIIVALGFVPGVSAATLPSASGNVQGVLVFGILDQRTFSFSATQQSTGTVTGNANLNSTSMVIQMSIDCLNFVAPNPPYKVFVSGKVTTSNDLTRVGQTALFSAVDNHSGVVTPTPDELSVINFSGLDCLSAAFATFQLPPTWPIVNGSIIVCPSGCSATPSVGPPQKGHQEDTEDNEEGTEDKEKSSKHKKGVSKHKEENSKHKGEDTKEKGDKD